MQEQYAPLPRTRSQGDLILERSSFTQTSFGEAVFPQMRVGPVGGDLVLERPSFAEPSYSERQSGARRPGCPQVLTSSAVVVVVAEGGSPGGRRVRTHCGISPVRLLGPWPFPWLMNPSGSVATVPASCTARATPSTSRRAGWQWQHSLTKRTSS